MSLGSGPRTTGRRSLRRRLGAAGRFAACLPLLLRAIARVRLLDRERPLDEQVRGLRSVAPLRSRRLRDPWLLAASLDRLLRWLPPSRHGACWRRSLPLLDLWARCGLEPCLVIGVRPGGEGRAGHAWIVSSRRPEIATSGRGFEETFRL